MNYSKAIKLLNLNYNANESEIKNSYKKLAKIYHPDKNQGDKDKEEKFKEIQVAYDFLVKNPNPQLQFHQENIFQQGFNIDQLFSQFNINNNLFNNNLFNNDLFNNNFYPLPNQQVFIQKKREIIDGNLVETITEKKNGVTRTTKRVIEI